MTVTFRPWEPGDEKDICTLFADSFGRPMDPDFWDWRFAQNPLGGPWVELAWDGTRLVGHYAISPLELVHGDTRLLTALSMTTMTHPDYRGQDLFGRLADRLYERLQAAGFACVWGFPNRFSHRLFISRLKWRDIGEIPTLTLDLKDARVSVPADGAKLVTCRQAPDWLDPMAESEGLGYMRFGRGRALYDWRVFKAHEGAGRAFVLKYGDKDMGFAALKPYGRRSYDILDFVAVDADAAGMLLALLVDMAKRDNMERLQIWLMLHHPFRGIMERAGFIADAPVTMLGARWFQPVSYDPYDMRLWRLPMIASDVY